MQEEDRHENKASDGATESQPEEGACDAQTESLHRRGDGNIYPIYGSGALAIWRSLLDGCIVSSYR
jgi:hypothetical protein